MYRMDTILSALTMHATISFRHCNERENYGTRMKYSQLINSSSIESREYFMTTKFVNIEIVETITVRLQ